MYHWSLIALPDQRFWVLGMFDSFISEPAPFSNCQRSALLLRYPNSSFATTHATIDTMGFEQLPECSTDLGQNDGQTSFGHRRQIAIFNASQTILHSCVNSYSSRLSSWETGRLPRLDITILPESIYRSRQLHTPGQAVPV